MTGSDSGDAGNLKCLVLLLVSSPESEGYPSFCHQSPIHPSPESDIAISATLTSASFVTVVRIGIVDNSRVADIAIESGSCRVPG